MMVRSNKILGAAAVILVVFGCATGKFWQRWSVEEQKRYFGLSFIADDSTLSAYRSLSEPELRDAWCRTFWVNDHNGVNF
ncbi:MAG: hypothetical protein QME74_06350, partial [Candidatus Edwardsbacteria bacterium]|nr:hypothetical protein [Candidatus Edwardsbacteria bacterium]